MEQGAALRVLGQAYEASGDVVAADEAFRQSVEVLEATQSRPELAQTLLAQGRFRSRSGNGDGRVLIERALALFEEMDATGCIAEARAALQAPHPALSPRGERVQAKTMARRGFSTTRPRIARSSSPLRRRRGTTFSSRW